MRKYLCVLVFLSVMAEAKELRECERDEILWNRLWLLSDEPLTEDKVEHQRRLEEIIYWIQTDEDLDPNLCDHVYQREETPLFTAMIRDNIDLMKVYLNIQVEDLFIDMDKDGVKDTQYILDPSRVGDLYVTQRVTHANDKPMSILAYAAYIGSKAIDFIIEQAPDLVHKGTAFGHPIHAAADGLQMESFNKLEEAGADIYIKGEFGKTALNYLARADWEPFKENDEEFIAKQLPLLDHLVKERDFDINQPDDLGITPYLEAAFSYNIQAMEHMQKELGADPFLEDNEGRSALDVVVIREIDHGFEYKEETSILLIKTRERKRLDAVEYLITKVGIKPDADTLRIANETLQLNYDAVVAPTGNPDLKSPAKQRPEVHAIFKDVISLLESYME